MIILFIWITIIIALFILFSKIKISILNKEAKNFVKVKFNFITLNLDYNRFIKTIKKINLINDIGLKEQIQNYSNFNPLIKDIMKQVVIDEAYFYKFFNEYSQTYEVITYYLLSSYFNCFMEFNFKKIKKYLYMVLHSNDRDDIDFIFKANIRMIYLITSFIKNIKVLFKNKKRRDL